jgi:hypothetical protein
MILSNNQTINVGKISIEYKILYNFYVNSINYRRTLVVSRERGGHQSTCVRYLPEGTSLHELQS